jgi:hypothetical protein
MCMNCGCGQLDTRHKDTDIIREDIQRAAQGQGSSMEETAKNLEMSMRQLSSFGGSQTAGASGAYAGATKPGATSGTR